MPQRNIPEVTGAPDWPRARQVAASLLDLPSVVGEEEVRSHLRELLGRLFPKLAYPEIAVEYQTGDGPADVVCRNLVVETKSEGKLESARSLSDGSTETPEEQLERYVAALSRAQGMFFQPVQGWQGLVTDGKRWDFYEFDPDKPDGARLVNTRTLQLDDSSGVARLLLQLQRCVDSETKIAPPTHDATWSNSMVKGFVKLASRVSTAESFQMKLALWRDMLKGAFITSPDSAESELNLFASHTMLVVAARAVAKAIEPDTRPDSNVEDRNYELAEGFPTWLLDVGGDQGAKLINDLVHEVSRYEWRRSDRDNLKDMYHAVIPRDIRHDFGEYYTPDWLARAVCEEVLDSEWREQVIDAVLDGTIVGPAVLDPSCGSGTFLYHASKLLLETAAQHPELKDNPDMRVQVVNLLVGGMDLHPVAVELAKVTKALAFACEGVQMHLNDDPGVYVGDSLQWSLRTGRAPTIGENVVEVPTADPADPIRLPRSLVMDERFLGLLDRMFDFARVDDYPQAEEALLYSINPRTEFERKTVIKAFHRIREYIQTNRNHVWQWYIGNLMQPLRLSAKPMTRLVGNPPWVVYNKMASERQDKLRTHALDRNVWAPAKLAPHNDLAATFVATCVDEYLAEGGQFGFVMPYATLQARQWEQFRTGEWTSLTSPCPTKADLSQPAWDMTGVQEPPFPHVNSSVIFGTKLDPSSSQTKTARPLKAIQRVVGTGAEMSMGWDEVKPKLEWETSDQWPSEPSEEYAPRFRQGAILSPQSLVVFDDSTRTRGLKGTVGFETNQAKGEWNALQRTGRVEERFVLKATFSRHLVPFGVTGSLNVIAPVSADGKSLTRESLSDDDAASFRLYWSSADFAYQQTRRSKSEPDLLSQIDNRGKLSARLAQIDRPCLVYNAAGSWLSSAVVGAGHVIDSTLYWISSGSVDELHYLASVFNAPALSRFFQLQGRNSDRHFHTGPIRSLPIPAFNPDDATHQQLVKASRAAHRRVAKLDEVNRDGVLADRYVQRNLAQIDAAVREMLPEYCTVPDTGDVAASSIAA